MRIKNNKTFQYILKASFSVILIVVAFKNIDIDLIINNIKATNIVLYLLLPLIAIIQKIFNIGVFSNIFTFTGIIYRNKAELFITSFKSSIYSLAFPGVSAPDVYLTAHFTNKNNSLKKVLVTLFLNRISGFIISIIIGLITVGFLISKFNLINFLDNSNWENYLLIGIVLVFFLILLFLIFYNYFQKLWKAQKDNLAAIKSKLISNKLFFSKFLFFKTIWYVFSIASRVFLGKLIGININYFDLVAIIIVVNFLIALPLSISGIGIRETSFIALLGLFGVNAEHALLLSILDFGILLCAVIIGSMILFTEKSRDLFNIIHKCER